MMNEHLPALEEALALGWEHHRVHHFRRGGGGIAGGRGDSALGGQPVAEQRLLIRARLRLQSAATALAYHRR